MNKHLFKRSYDWYIIAFQISKEINTNVSTFPFMTINNATAQGKNLLKETVWPTCCTGGEKFIVLIYMIVFLLSNCLKSFCCKCHTYTSHVYISFINVYEAISKENISWLKKSVPHIFVHMNKKALKTDGKSFKNTKRFWNMVWGNKIGSYFYMIKCEL